MQAYRLWLQTEHEYLFFVNNDVLVPDGVIDALARAMTAEGSLGPFLCSDLDLLFLLMKWLLVSH